MMLFVLKKNLKNFPRIIENFINQNLKILFNRIQYVTSCLLLLLSLLPTEFLRNPLKRQAEQRLENPRLANYDEMLLYLQHHSYVASSHSFMEHLLFRRKLFFLLLLAFTSSNNFNAEQLFVNIFHASANSLSVGEVYALMLT